MPRDTNVIGTRDYTPTPEQIQRIKTFMQWLPLNKASGTVVITPWQNFRDLAHSYGANTTTALTNPDVDRTYINASVFDKGSPHTIEWVLAHEAAHLNSPGIGRIQEQRDGQFDDVANQLVREYESPQGQAFQHTQAQVDATQGQFQPTPAPLRTVLQPLAASRHGFLRAIGDVAQDVQIGANAGNASLPNRIPTLGQPDRPLPIAPPVIKK